MLPEPEPEPEQYELEALHEEPPPTMAPGDIVDATHHNEELHMRTLRKLDFLLLPFLALLFLFNSLDKSNVRRLQKQLQPNHADGES